MPAKVIRSGGARLPRAPVDRPRLGLTFLSGDPPRLGAFVLYDRSASQRVDARGGEAGHHGPFELDATSTGALLDPDALSQAIEVVLPHGSGGGVRRRSVAARRLAVLDALAFVDRPHDAVEGAAAWSAVLTSGLALLTRGRLYPR